MSLIKKLKVGNIVEVNLLNGKEIKDKGIVVEIFDNLFFYYSFNEKDLKDKVKSCHIIPSNLDQYNIIK